MNPWKHFQHGFSGYCSACPMDFYASTVLGFASNIEHDRSYLYSKPSEWDQRSQLLKDPTHRFREIIVGGGGGFGGLPGG